MWIRFSSLHFPSDSWRRAQLGMEIYRKKKWETIFSESNVVMVPHLSVTHGLVITPAHRGRSWSHRLVTLSLAECLSVLFSVCNVATWQRWYRLYNLRHCQGEGEERSTRTRAKEKDSVLAHRRGGKFGILEKIVCVRTSYPSVYSLSVSLCPGT